MDKVIKKAKIVEIRRYATYFMGLWYVLVVERRRGCGKIRGVKIYNLGSRLRVAMVSDGKWGFVVGVLESG